MLLQSALKEYSTQLGEDAVVKRHLDDLFKALLEQNLVRIITPYRRVQVRLQLLLAAFLCHGTRHCINRLVEDTNERS
jgi:hypothetical protein